MSLLSFAKKVSGEEKAKTAAKSASKEETAKKSTAKPKKAEVQVPDALPAGVVYIEPLITEKSLSSDGVYAFRVRPEVSKGQIMASVKSRYNVTPRMIRTLIVRPKARRRGATTGTTSTWKKAYVTLPKGKTIDLTV